MLRLMFVHSLEDLWVYFIYSSVGEVRLDWVQEMTIKINTDKNRNTDENFI